LGGDHDNLIYGRAREVGGGAGFGSGGGGSVHLHGWGFGREERVGQAGGGNEAIYLYRLGPGRTRGTRGRTRALSGPTHLGSKSEAEMGARGQV
jgi:hypothetical protein